MRIENFTEDNAKEVCCWAYEGEYSVYNYPSWEKAKENKYAITNESIRKDEFVSFLDRQDFIGFGRISFKDNKMLIGIGLSPKHCGKRLGQESINLLIEESQRRYPNHDVYLRVRKFNQRAIKCYRKCGFETILENDNQKLDEKQMVQMVRYF